MSFKAVQTNKPQAKIHSVFKQVRSRRAVSPSAFVCLQTGGNSLLPSSDKLGRACSAPNYSREELHPCARTFVLELTADEGSQGRKTASLALFDQPLKNNAHINGCE